MPKVDYEEPMAYGMGVESLKLKARGTGVEGDEPQAVAGPAQTVSFALLKIDSYDQYQKAFGFDADASASYGLFHGSAKFSFAEQHSYNSYSKYLVASIVVANALQQIGRPRLTAEAADVYSRDVKRFQEQFGDSFVLGMTTGGAYYAVLEFNSSNSADLHDISAALEVGAYGVFSGEASFSSAVQHFKGQTSLRVHSFQQGGTDTTQAVNVDDIIAKAAGFAPEVREQALPVSVFLQDYKSLSLPSGPNLVDIDNARLVMQNYASLRNDLVRKLNDVQYVQLHPEQFVDPESFDLDGMQQQISMALRVLTANASQCANDIRSCQFPTVDIPSVRLPPRQPGAEPEPSVAQVEVPLVADRKGISIPAVSHALLLRAGLQFRDEGALQIVQDGQVLKGEVIAQNPLGGTMVDQGTVVALQIGNYRVPGIKALGRRR